MILIQRHSVTDVISRHFKREVISLKSYKHFSQLKCSQFKESHQVVSNVSFIQIQVVILALPYFFKQYTTRQNGKKFNGYEYCICICIGINTGSLPSSLQQLVNETQIFIVPSINPDGREQAVEKKCSSSLGLTNSNGKDLDRTFFGQLFAYIINATCLSKPGLE